MMWHDLSDEQKEDYLIFFNSEYNAEHGYTEEDIEMFRKGIFTAHYYIEDEKTYQF